MGGGPEGGPGEKGQGVAPGEEEQAEEARRLPPHCRRHGARDEKHVGAQREHLVHEEEVRRRKEGLVVREGGGAGGGAA